MSSAGGLRLSLDFHRYYGYAQQQIGGQGRQSEALTALAPGVPCGSADRVW
jgi:hypothetical protein